MNICILGSARDIHVTTRARGLAAKGHGVTMLSPVSATVPGITVIAPPDGAGKFASLWFMARATLRQCPDVFYAHYASEYVCWLAALMRRRPFAVHAMGSDVLLDAMGRNGALRSWLTRRALHHADLLTVKSPFITDALLSLGISAGHIHEVIWGIDPELCQRDEAARARWRAEWGLDDTATVVFSPRPLESLYRQQLLIEALPSLLEKQPSSWVVISEYNQDAAYRDRLSHLARELNVGHRVLFLPGQAAADMPGLLSAADIVASLAYTDGTPQTVLEAQAVGTPVLMADIPDLRAVFTHGQDCWMADATSIAIAEALAGPLTDPGIRNSIVSGGTRLIQQKANFPKEVTRVESLLKDITR